MEYSCFGCRILAPVAPVGELVIPLRFRIGFPDPEGSEIP
jgi:hypothetical protein